MAEKKNVPPWFVSLTKKAQKGVPNLSEIAAEALAVLVYELQTLGPYRKRWQNFGMLQGTKNCFHCHLNKGRPRYVVCWRVENNIIEVYYVGTHQNAPYD